MPMMQPRKYVNKTLQPEIQNGVQLSNDMAQCTVKLGWLGSRVVSLLRLRRRKAQVQIAVATLSGNSLRLSVHTRCASVHQTAKLVAALLRVVWVTAGLAESNGSLPPGLWLISPAGWLPRTGISSGTLCSVIEYGLPFLQSNWLEKQVRIHYHHGALMKSGHNISLLFLVRGKYSPPLRIYIWPCAHLHAVPTFTTHTSFDVKYIYSPLIREALQLYGQNAVMRRTLVSFDGPLQRSWCFTLSPFSAKPRFSCMMCRPSVGSKARINTAVPSPTTSSVNAITSDTYKNYSL